MKLSLRARLSLSFAAAVAATLIGFSAAVVLVLREADRAERAAQHLPPDDSDSEGDLRRVLLAMAVALPVAMGGAAALGVWLAGRAVRPLREASARARAARASSLELTLPGDGGAEWDELAATLNTLLADGRASLLRIRRFTADAAHELRTPLTAILGEAEVSLRRERTGPEQRASLEVVHEQAARLAALVDALLLLARGDEGVLLAQGEAVPLDALVREAAEAARAGRGEAAVVEVTGEAGAVRGSRLLLLRAVGNVIENGLLHGGGAVNVRLGGEPGHARVRIEDGGPGVPQALRPSLFLPFTRADEARSGAGLGLGLSLARAIAVAHGGTLELLASERGAAFEFRLPLQGPRLVC